MGWGVSPPSLAVAHSFGPSAHSFGPSAGCSTKTYIYGYMIMNIALFLRTGPMVVLLEGK